MLILAELFDDPGGVGGIDGRGGLTLAEGGEPGGSHGVNNIGISDVKFQI
jgi:hypothetical protein